MHAVLVPVYLLLVTPITLSWWAAAGAGSPGTPLVMDPRSICKKRRRLRGEMATICKDTDLLEQIRYGIKLGQEECQHQFRNRRWNCTSVRRSIRKVLLRDTRETGFVNAMLAAGVTYQVTRACTAGDAMCSCARNKKHKKGRKSRKVAMPAGDWEWEGCGSENVAFGLKKSKDFLDARYKKRSDMKTKVKLHNYVAGRLAIKNHMRTECKCHGLSGSCTLTTCWRKMPPFREVGNRLKEHFDGAVRVIAANDGQSFMTEDSTLKPPSRVDLIYSEDIPSDFFCRLNNTIGSLGTKERICVKDSQAEEGCDLLCCGRGYEDRIKEESNSCRCKFLWCCEVKCETCNETKIVSVCK